MSGHVTLTGGNGLLAPAAAAVGLPSVFHMLHAIHISITCSRLKSTMLLKLCSIIYYGLRLCGSGLETDTGLAGAPSATGAHDEQLRHGFSDFSRL